MTLARSPLAGAATVLLAVVVGAGPAAADECAVPAELMQVSVRLPHVAARLHRRQPVRIVAIGGASTRGAAAGAPDRAYPRRLERALAGLFPAVPITVVNRGVPRQSAEQMLARFPSDVFLAHPDLVVWEVGISDAVRGVEPDDFAAALERGIHAVRSRGSDIVLVDMQFSHAAAAVIDFTRYLDIIRRVGELNDVYVFPRFAIMHYWSEQHMFRFEDVATGERARLAAAVYDCIGRRLAEAIGRAVR
jgi:acyl-CoA thioesterase I